MKTIKLIRGFFRLFVFGVCPKCNHDAPKLYDCGICCYYEKLDRYKSDQTKDQRELVWMEYKETFKTKEK